MKIESSSRFYVLLTYYVKAVSVVTSTVGFVVLLGWYFQVAFLKSIIPNAATMKFNTALGFIGVGISIWFLHDERGDANTKRVGKFLAGFILLMGLLALGEYMFKWNLGVDQLFIKDLATPPNTFPGRMSQITSVCFVLSGLALLTIDSRASQYFSVGVTILSLLAVIGYLFDFRSLYQLAGYGSIAVHTSIIFLLVSLAILAMRPAREMVRMVTSDLTGSRALRLLLPGTLLVTILLGWLVELGDRLGIFDQSNESVILVVSLIFIYSPLIYLYAERINRSEAEIIRLNHLYAMLSQVNQTIVRVKDQDSLYQTICDVSIQFGELSQAWIGLIDQKTGEVQVAAFKNENSTQVPFTNINIRKPPFDSGLIGTAVRDQVIVTSSDIQTDPRLKHWREESQIHGYRSAAAVPFKFGNEIIGIFNLYAVDTGFFQKDEELHLLREIGGDISFALENMEAERAKFYLANIVESSNDAIVAKDLNGIITSWNNGAERIFGYTADEMIGQPILKLIPPERTDEEERILNQIKRDQLVDHFETVRLKKNGDRIDVSITVSPVKDSRGRVIGASKIARDITERKQAEGRIRQQLRRLSILREIDRDISGSMNLRSVLETVLENGRAELNVDAAVILLYDPGEQMLKYELGAGMHTDALQFTHLKPGDGYAGRAAQSGKTIFVPNLQKHMTDFLRSPSFSLEGFVCYFGVPLIMKGEIKGVLEIFHRSALEPKQEWLSFMETLAGQTAIAIDNAQLWEQTQRHALDLEQQVAERTAELNRTNLELQHANRAKDEFLATMSHELRTPLNSILGLSESLLEQRRGPLNEYQQKSLQIIESSGRHLLELINDVLDLSKIEAGKFDYYPQVVDVDTLCRSSLAFVNEQALRKSISLNYDKQDTVSKIYADPRRLKQVLVNLLTNAVKFTPEKGQVRLQVQADAEQDLVQFSIIDNGIGIAPDDLKKLFRPFVQVDNALNRQYEGTGLGLALVQKLIDMHGGSVEVESQVGRGSRFTVNIPWNRQQVAQQEVIESGGELTVEKSPKTAQKKSYKPLTILMAEDNLTNILTVGEYLENHGHKVLNAHDGAEAIQMAEDANPDIILMDIQMPVMDGLEAIRRLRANPRFDSTPIIALTALAMPGDRELCLEAGANEYMSKPVSLKKLVKTINDMVGQKK